MTDPIWPSFGNHDTVPTSNDVITSSRGSQMLLDVLESSHLQSKLVGSQSLGLVCR